MKMKNSLSLAPVKSRLLLPFWYRLTQVVLEKRPLNGCSSSNATYIMLWRCRHSHFFIFFFNFVLLLSAICVLSGIRKGDEHPAITPLWVQHHLCFTAVMKYCIIWAARALPDLLHSASHAVVYATIIHLRCECHIMVWADSQQYGKTDSRLRTSNNAVAGIFINVSCRC